MEATVTPYHRCVLVKFGGFLEGDAVDELEKILDSVTDSGNYNIVLDMSDVSLISSKGVKLLIATQKKCQRFHRGKLVLAGVNPRIQKALKLVGMTDYFTMYDQVVEAVGSF